MLLLFELQITITIFSSYSYLVSLSKLIRKMALVIFGFVISSALIIFHLGWHAKLFNLTEKTTNKSISNFIIFLVVGGLVYSMTWLSTSEFLYYNPVEAWLFVFLITACALGTYDLINLSMRNENKVSADRQKIEQDRLELHQEKNALDEERLRLKNEADELSQKTEQTNKLNDTLRNDQSKLNAKENVILNRENLLRRQEQDLNSARADLEQQVKIQLNEREGLLKQEFENKLSDEKNKLQVLYNQKIAEFMDSVTAKMEQRIFSEKKNVVDDIFKFQNPTKDDSFEIFRTRESLNKEKEIIEKDKFLLDVDSRLNKSKEHVLEAKNSALEIRSENFELRSDLKVMASEFKNELLQERTQREKSYDGVLHKLELEEEKRKSDHRDVGNKIALLAEQTKGKFIELTSMFSDNIKDLEMRTMTSFREVRENMSDMKLHFGQEVLRLDGQQGQILTELEKYYNKNQEFVHKCQNLALEAKKQNIDGNHLLNQVTSIYSQHKMEARAMENQLQNSLDQVAVKEGHLANRIGESMLQLKSISDQQFIAAKDLALKKKDVNLLWREKNQEHEMNLQEVRHQKQDLDRMKQFLDQEKSQFNDRKTEVMDNARLTHQLYMTEHRYTEALKKAQSSQGFLTRIAKAAEYAMSAK